MKRPETPRPPLRPLELLAIVAVLATVAFVVWRGGAVRATSPVFDVHIESGGRPAP